MTATKGLPKLRDLEAIHYKAQGQDMFCLRDPFHLSDAQLHVSPDVFVIASFFDGTRDIRDVQTEFLRRFGVLIKSEDVQRVVDALEQAHFLEGESFEQWRKSVEAEFRGQPVRQPILAGGCYPEDHRDIGNFLEQFFKVSGGPGLPAARTSDKPLRGLIVPHIDIRRGGKTYAFGYKAFAEAAPPELVVILGVAHAGREALYTLTKKDFETPLGVLKTDPIAVDRLAQKLGQSAFADEFAHKGEHSIEIQLIWLQHFCRPTAPKLVPVLCGSFHEFVASGTSPRTCEEVRRMIEALGELLRDSSGRVMLLASADLAHIGMKFGDRVPITDRLLKKNEQMDRRMLEFVQAGDAEGFYEFVKAEKDRRKICGLVAIYTMLAALEAANGSKVPMKLLGYEQSQEDVTQSLVSFAALAAD